METITVVATDDTELRETIAELSELQVGLNGDIEAGLFDSFVDCPLDFYEVENGPAAAGTNQLGVRIKKSQRLIDLIAALRARHLVQHASA